MISSLENLFEIGLPGYIQTINDSDTPLEASDFFVHNAVNSTYRFYSDYNRLYQNYYLKAKFNSKKINILIINLNMHLVNIFKEFIFLFHYNNITSAKVDLYIQQILENTKLLDSDYYNNPDDLTTLFNISQFINKQYGLGSSTERPLHINGSFSACNYLSSETLSEVKLVLFELHYLLNTTDNEEEEGDKLIAAFIMLFQLFNILKLDRNTLNNLYTETNK